MKKKLVIAIFEEDPINRFIYQRMLHPHLEKASIYIFNSPEEGLEMAGTMNFDIAFIDMHLKGERFGGLSLSKQLKSVSNDTKLVAMTTFIQYGDLEHVESNGFMKCLEKPLPFFDFDKLLAGIINN
jgi:CheY-like chemotaxis protein